MTRIVPFTKNRQAIYNFLSRARKFHCTSNTIHEFDVTEMLKAYKEAKATAEPVSLNACLIKATSLVIEKFPRLNHHLFHGILRKYEVEFDEISCNMVMLREHDDELILLPVIIERTNELSLNQIDEVIAYHLKTPLHDLPQVQGMQKMKALPVLGMKLFSYLCRSNHRFYRKYFGTYGYSSLITEDERVWQEDRLGIISTSVANTGVAFQPTSISMQPFVIDDQVLPRSTLTMTVLGDHYLLDAHYGLMAMRYFRTLLENPQMIGLPARLELGKQEAS